MLLTRLEKAAADCGFELTPELRGDALLLASTQFPETVHVHVLGNDVFCLSASVPAVLSGIETPERLEGYESLYGALQKIAAAARNFPNRVASQFHQATAYLLKSTEAERLVVQRVGQELFRKALLDYWQGKCCVTGLAVPQLLRASHIRPWAQCSSDDERLNVFNGLLLSPDLDALFDGGWITFSVVGKLVISDALPQSSRALMGLHTEMSINLLTDVHQQFLSYHREHVFKTAAVCDLAAGNTR